MPKKQKRWVISGDNEFLAYLHPIKGTTRVFSDFEYEYLEPEVIEYFIRTQPLIKLDELYGCYISAREKWLNETYKLLVGSNCER